MESAQDGQVDGDALAGSPEERRPEGGVASSGDYDSNQSASNKQTQETQTEEQIITSAGVRIRSQKQQI